MVEPQLWICWGTLAFHYHDISIFLSFFLSFLGSTAQLRPWPPPQNPAEFLGGFPTIFFFKG
jgi:heme/copper-type cytochrome/quinol oxidase subunit 3